MRMLTVAMTVPASSRLQHAHQILEDGLDSCESFLGFYTSSRGAKRGSGSHSEQDLLRAMVVFAGATVDASLRIAVREVLPDFVDKNARVRGLLKSSVSANLRGQETKGIELQFSAIIDALFKENLEPLVANTSSAITGKGVQDRTRARRMLSFVDVDIEPHWTTALEDALAARNDIVHELDARWSRSTGRGIKNRTTRQKDAMIAHTETLLTFAQSVLTAIDAAYAAL